MMVSRVEASSFASPDRYLNEAFPLGNLKKFKLLGKSLKIADMSIFTT